MGEVQIMLDAHYEREERLARRIARAERRRVRVSHPDA